MKKKMKMQLLRRWRERRLSLWLSGSRSLSLSFFLSFLLSRRIKGQRDQKVSKVWGKKNGEQQHHGKKKKKKICSPVTV